MLTKKQKQILDFVKKYSAKKGFAPALEEIKKHFRLRSVATIHQHIATLRDKGYLHHQKNQPRGVEISKSERMVRVPIVGTITAGQPIEAIEIPSSMVTVSQKDLLASEKHYALRVKGESMIDEGIFDGDIVVIRQQTTADDGQTVVAIIDNNEATLKKIYKEKNRVRLQPANQTLLPFYHKEVEVRGIVVKIIRNLDNQIGVTNHSLAERKRVFLNRIKSANPDSQNKYKRVALSPIRYAGGKSLAVGHIVELLTDTVQKVVSPFFSDGSTGKA